MQKETAQRIINETPFSDWTIDDDAWEHFIANGGGQDTPPPPDYEPYPCSICNLPVYYDTYCECLLQWSEDQEG